MRIRNLLAIMAPLLLTACWDDNNYNSGPSGPSGPTANFQALHASPDAPDLIVLIDGQVWFDELHYGEGTGGMTISAGSHTVSVQAETPAGPVTVIGPTTSDFQRDNDYVIVAEGPFASMGPAVFPHPLSTVASTATRIQVVHAAPSTSAVAVYLTAPGAALSTSPPPGTGSLAFMGAIAPTDVTSGQYEIRITLITPSGAASP